MQIGKRPSPVKEARETMDDTPGMHYAFFIGRRHSRLIRKLVKQHETSFEPIYKNNVSPELIGRWEIKTEQQTWDCIESMGLLSNGTGAADGLMFKWKASDSHFYITSSSVTRLWDYTISDTTLILTDDLGNNTTYQKQ